jgi:hypothetical protein
LGALRDIATELRVTPDLESSRNYGTMLRDALFRASELRDLLVTARAAAQFPAEGAGNCRGLRIRLTIDPGAEGAGEVLWETLEDTEGIDGGWMAGRSDTYFSRYVYSGDTRRVKLRPRRNWRALVVIANPRNPRDADGDLLQPLKVEAEERNARAALCAGEQPIPCDVLSDPGQTTLDNIAIWLRREYDILYLVCHGVLAADGPYLLLSEPNGAAKPVDGAKLLECLNDLNDRPRLVFLASCESAGSVGRTAAGGRSALGYQMAVAGIPAVVAMQGRVDRDTVGTLARGFFHELRRDERDAFVDRAMARARHAIRNCADRWMPVLYMRLDDGQISWYRPRFAGDDEGLERWPALLNRIWEGECTPVLGPGMTEPLVGPWRDVARALATKQKFPMAAHGRDDLPQVAQFIASTQDYRLLRGRLAEELTAAASSRYPEVHSASPTRSLSEAGQACRKHDALDPTRVLAALPLPVYLTTNADNVLEDALGETRTLPAECLETALDALEVVDSRLQDLGGDYTELVQDVRSAKKQIADLHSYHRIAHYVPLETQGDLSQMLNKLSLSVLPLGYAIERARVDLAGTDARGTEGLSKAAEQLGEARKALEAAKTRPRADLYRWRSRDEEDKKILWPDPVISKAGSAYRPSCLEPLVYHLFGSWSVPASVVLTEDDYFDYLMSLDRPHQRIPQPVREALRAKPVLFLGFHLNDWHLRVLLRYIYSGEHTQFSSLRHVAVQVDPEEWPVEDPAGARKFLETRFGRNIDIYWGRPQDFARQLSDRWMEDYKQNLGSNDVRVRFSRARAGVGVTE